MFTYLGTGTFQETSDYELAMLGTALIQGSLKSMNMPFFFVATTNRWTQSEIIDIPEICGSY